MVIKKGCLKKSFFAHQFLFNSRFTKKLILPLTAQHKGVMLSPKERPFYTTKGVDYE